MANFINKQEKQFETKTRWQTFTLAVKTKETEKNLAATWTSQVFLDHYKPLRTC